MNAHPHLRLDTGGDVGRTEAVRSVEKEKLKGRKRSERGWREYTYEVGEVHPHSEGEVHPVAAEYVASLRQACDGDWGTNPNRSAANKLQKVVSSVLGPMIWGFLDWVHLSTQEMRVKPLYIFLYRDAWPLYHVAKTRKEFWGNMANLHVNRPLMGVPDEFGFIRSPTVEESLLRTYLSNLILKENRHRIVLVDFGQYGTVLESLFRRFSFEGRKPVPFRPQARFFFSRNRYIPGYTDYMGLPLELGATLADTMEIVIPKKEWRVEGLTRVSRGDVQPISESTGAISQRLVQAAMEGLDRMEDKDPWTAMKHALEKSQGTRRSRRWSGVLGEGIPPWSEGPAFLAAWPEALMGVNPAIWLPGGLDSGRQVVEIPNGMG